MCSQDITIASADENVASAPIEAIRAMLSTLAGSPAHVRVAVPETIGSNLIRFVTRNRSPGFTAIDVSATPARFGTVSVRSDVASASHLIGLGGIGTPTSPGPLAIELWSRFVDPRLSIPIARSPGRHPETADLALAFSPLRTVLTGTWQGYVVLIGSGDLVALELVALAIRAASIRDPELRPRPWEDPVIQRATELDLGVLLPSQIDLQTAWAGPPDPHGTTALAALTSVVRELLNLPEASIGMG